ncbi:MAG TPA: UDP-2,3-diacylglucosamine diphosphatase [Candidatus Angelobacter sp.]|nr:UDP-2,3-diacylglucosamine diphosphatase [Candidatus Angelobacter sp.]
MATSSSVFINLLPSCHNILIFVPQNGPKMAESYFDTLIISDVHLGSEISRAQNVVQMLRATKFRRLILLGDIFSDLDFRRLKKEHWAFLSYIRKLSNPKRNIEIVWVEGNHDHGLSNLMSHLVGIPVYRQYVWEFQGIRHLAVHGHQFDRFVVNNFLLSRLGEWLFLQMQKIDPKGKAVARYLDRLNTRWLRLSNKVAAGAFEHARHCKAQRVFCGHTHVALEQAKDEIHYYNSGSWVDSRCTYITIDEEGVKLHEYQERAYDSDPGEEREETSAAAVGVAVPPGLSLPAGYDSVYC